MIKIVPAEEKFMECQSCYSNDDVKFISIGMDTAYTTSFRLCWICRESLRNLLNEDTADYADQ